MHRRAVHTCIGVVGIFLTSVLAAPDHCELWAASGECETNPAFMRAACRRQCECARWAADGECVQNAGWMLTHCERACTRPPPAAAPPPSLLTECPVWAQAGECERNRQFMLQSCAAECTRVSLRLSCSAAACQGLPSEPIVCVPEPPVVLAAASHTHPWHMLPSLGAPVQVPLALVNIGDHPVQLFWVDHLGSERGFGVIMPGARYVQETYLGHHWRVREHRVSGDGDLLLDTHARLLVARSCDCDGHLIEDLGSKRDVEFGFDDTNATALLVELRAAVVSTVWLWNGTTEALVGTLHPPNSFAPNATHQLLISGVRAGNVVTVRRAVGGGVFMQHLVSDTAVVGPCTTDGLNGTQRTHKVAGRAATTLTAGRGTGNGGERRPSAATVASKREALQRRRDVFRSGAEAMREQLELLKQLDHKSLGALPEELLREYVDRAVEVLQPAGAKRVVDHHGPAAEESPTIAQMQPAETATEGMGAADARNRKLSLSSSTPASPEKSDPQGEPRQRAAKGVGRQKRPTTQRPRSERTTGRADADEADPKHGSGERQHDELRRLR